MQHYLPDRATRLACFTFVSILLLLVASPLPSQITEEEIVVPQYDLGDQFFTISLGPLFPLFFQNPNEGFFNANPDMNLNFAGGTGSLAWHGFLNNEWSIGGRLTGSFTNSVNGRTLYIVPITFEANYLISAFPFEFPLSVGTGMSFTGLSGDTYVGPVVSFGGGAHWRFTEDWAFGLNTNWFWVPQFYTNSERTPPPSDSRFGNFLELGLSARYSF
ncbi:MAG: TP0733 family outer membrane beta-barrel protein [Spirochaetaceae bacterium]